MVVAKESCISAAQRRLSLDGWAWPKKIYNEVVCRRETILAPPSSLDPHPHLASSVAAEQLLARMKLTTYFVALALCASAVTVAAPVPPGDGVGMFKGAVKSIKKLGSWKSSNSRASEVAEDSGFGSASLSPSEIRGDRDHVPSHASTPEASRPPSPPSHEEGPHAIVPYSGAAPAAPAAAPAAEAPYIPMQRMEPYEGAFSRNHQYDPYAGLAAQHPTYPMHGHGYQEPGRAMDPYHAPLGTYNHYDPYRPAYHPPVYPTGPGVAPDSYLNPHCKCWRARFGCFQIRFLAVPYREGFTDSFCLFSSFQRPLRRSVCPARRTRPATGASWLGPL